MARRKIFQESVEEALQQAPKNEDDKGNVTMLSTVHRLEARVKELEAGIKFIGARLRWSCDWVSQSKCESLLKPQPLTLTPLFDPVASEPQA